MPEDNFVAYVGDPDIHDGYIRNIEHKADSAKILIEGASGRYFTLEFSGVTSLKAHSAQDMMLYGLAEMRSDRAKRRFLFLNWEEESAARLEIDADDFTIIRKPGDAISA